jgi:hypothetical protein
MIGRFGGDSAMTRVIKSSAVVAASLWVGVLFCLGFVVAPYLFVLAGRNSPTVPNTSVAADLIGPLLYAADVGGLVVGAWLIAALVFLRWRGEVPLGGRVYLTEVGVGIAAICAAANYWVCTPRLKVIRAELAERYGAFHQADRADPLFRRFNDLHQASTILFVIGFVAALICLVCMTQFWSRQTTGQVVAA